MKEISIKPLSDREICQEIVKTVANYLEVIKESSMAYWKGPLGAFDKNPAFAASSKTLLEFFKENTKVFSVMGGGDTGQMLQAFKVKPESLGYVSLAGGALIKLLAGKNLPGIDALEESYRKFPL
jgi:phosphoglycerate kinase